MVGELDVDELVPEDGSDCGVVVDHGAGRLLRVHLYERLHKGKANTDILRVAHARRQQ